MTLDSSVMLMLAVAPFALAMTLSPGPTNFVIAAIASQYGARRTVPFLLGTLLGVTALMLAIGFGLRELFARWPSAYAWLKILGVAYVLGLAWRVATNSRWDRLARRVAKNSLRDRSNAQTPVGFGVAVLFQWLNLKAWMMAMGAFSIFSGVGGNLVAETLIISLTILLAFIPGMLLWTGVGVGAGQVLKSPGAMKIFSIVMGIMIAASVLTVLA